MSDTLASMDMVVSEDLGFCVGDVKREPRRLQKDRTSWIYIRCYKTKKSNAQQVVMPQSKAPCFIPQPPEFLARYSLQNYQASGSTEHELTQPSFIVRAGRLNLSHNGFQATHDLDMGMKEINGQRGN
ncbi:unnamed protein product [Fusarium venenatum]|uniref:Uncharacterized protein n=1 Tax=Fusarium venenatum TaxID=56646 RepID=A0A2L2TFL7_9HYPO|nr:uncharacterized protein FVRRES_11818 [Fusarium venenatum]CEI39127.1 unnamed protein product [Fusarium venenatum]